MVVSSCPSILAYIAAGLCVCLMFVHMRRSDLICCELCAHDTKERIPNLLCQSKVSATYGLVCTKKSCYCWTNVRSKPVFLSSCGPGTLFRAMSSSQHMEKTRMLKSFTKVLNCIKIQNSSTLDSAVNYRICAERNIYLPPFFRSWFNTKVIKMTVTCLDQNALWRL